MFDILALVVLACEIVAEFVLAVKPELIHLELIRLGFKSALR